MDKSRELTQRRFCLPRDQLEAILSGKVAVSLGNLFSMLGNLYIPYLRGQYSLPSPHPTHNQSSLLSFCIDSLNRTFISFHHLCHLCHLVIGHEFSVIWCQNGPHIGMALHISSKTSNFIVSRKPRVLHFELKMEI